MAVLISVTYLHIKMGYSRFLGADIPTQLWIAGRFIEAVSLFVVLLTTTTINRKLTNIVYTLTTVCLLLSIMVLGIPYLFCRRARAYKLQSAERIYNYLPSS